MSERTPDTPAGDVAEGPPRDAPTGPLLTLARPLAPPGPAPRAAHAPGLPADTDGRSLWAALGAAGRLRAAYTGADPAAGVDVPALRTLMAEADAVSGIGSTLALCVQIATAVPLLTLGGEQAAHVLDEALAGRAVVALAATDEGSGSDLTGLGTTVAIEADGLTVSGVKRWITNATHADHFLVLARHREGGHFTNFTWVLVPATAPGVHVEPADSQLFDGSGTGHLRLDGVRLERTHLVGRVGRGMTSFAAHIAVERLTGTLWAVALCHRQLKHTQQHLQGRKFGDGTLWGLESVRQRFADCLVRVHQLDALTDRLAERVARRHDTAAASLLKAAAAQTVGHVLGACAQLQGAEGFTTGGAQWTRAQAALWGVGGGATEVVLSAVAGSADSLLAELAP
ncbi:putative acyl-CoA dehydrogenase [Streptomyces sp. ADI96-02]|uniref:acyl-CoA dehydrogenase n=1 Tax=Streptomyces sp. ADI96-02 TaxID=1522760 RepID=UPI000F9408A3|nr:acyl-CoA dehydrogenase [Streptomyces sp. ADI96-02]RPK65817.1 putative acyl-CoA dehydrogenase [Streptomyces sp. ADI96-02]